MGPMDSAGNLKDDEARTARPAAAVTVRREPEWTLERLPRATMSGVPGSMIDLPPAWKKPAMSMECDVSDC